MCQVELSLVQLKRALMVLFGIANSYLYRIWFILFNSYMWTFG